MLEKKKNNWIYRAYRYLILFFKSLKKDYSNKTKWNIKVQIF